MTDHKRMHQQLLDMLGAKDQVDAARIIAGFQAAHLSAQANVRVTSPHSVEEITQMLAAVEKQGKEVVLANGASLSGMLLAYAARLSQDSAWQAIVQHCMVTEAVTPRDDDPYGTINDVISWHVSADRAAQGEAGAKLDKPALVGHTQFGIGIAWSTVIGAAQRAYEWKDDKLSPEQIAAFYIAFPHLAPSYEKVKQSAERAVVPDGWVMVPREPTLEMLRAEDEAVPSGDTEDDPFAWGKAIWEAMLTAAPQPPEGARAVEISP